MGLLVVSKTGLTSVRWQIFYCCGPQTLGNRSPGRMSLLFLFLLKTFYFSPVTFTVTTTLSVGKTLIHNDVYLYKVQCFERVSVYSNCPSPSRVRMWTKQTLEVNNHPKPVCAHILKISHNLPKQFPALH